MNEPIDLETASANGAASTMRDGASDDTDAERPPPRPPEAPPTPIPISSLVRERIGAKPPRRFPTGIATLDAITRGGMPEGRLALVGGAPGAGKTTLIVELADVAGAPAGACCS